MPLWNVFFSSKFSLKLIDYSHYKWKCGILGYPTGEQVPQRETRWGLGRKGTIQRQDSPQTTMEAALGPQLILT